MEWYSQNYLLGATDRNYLRTVVESILEIASLRQSAGLQRSEKQMADDETNRMYFNNLIGPPTSEREHLNLGKTGDSHKTNPSQLHPASPPAPTARENTWRTDETNHTVKGRRAPEEQPNSPKRIIPASREYRGYNRETAQTERVAGPLMGDI